MRIGQLATEIGVSTDTVRFYERAGWLPRPARRENAYREYSSADVDHLRLLIDLRRLDIPLEEAARIASWCHSGHCADTVSTLPTLISAKRAEIGERIERLRELDERLASLEKHLDRGVVRKGLSLNVLEDGAPCCDSADAIFGSQDGGCACCAAVAPSDA
jgi:DNA-binding transcriptional MerR regulator